MLPFFLAYLGAASAWAGDVGVGFMTGGPPGRAGISLDAGVDIGKARLRLLGFAPVGRPRELIGLEHALSGLSQAPASFGSERLVGGGAALAEFDFGARRITDDWSGGLRLYAGASGGALAVLEWQSDQAVEAGEGFRADRTATRLVGGPAVGAGLEVWDRGRVGARIVQLGQLWSVRGVAPHTGPDTPAEPLLDLHWLRTLEVTLAL